MGLWKTRHHSLEMLANEFKPQAQVIENAFRVIDECIELFDNKSAADVYHRICGLTLTKARNLALGMYGLILDGLGQEAGALLRPFIEYHELLTYYRLEPNRVQQAVNNKLPSAGDVARMIKGNFRNLRKYLNDHASHGSYSEYSLNHLLDRPDMKLRKEQPLLPDVLFKNMGDFFVQITFLSIEAVNCLQTAEMGYAEKQAEEIEALRDHGFKIFRLDERSTAKEKDQIQPVEQDE